MENIPSEIYGKYIKRIKIIKVVIVLVAIGFFVYFYLKGLLKSALIPYIVLIWYLSLTINEFLSIKLFKEMMKTMALANKWVHKDDLDEDSEENSWKFMDDLELFQLLNFSFKSISEQFILRGKLYDRDFSFHFIDATSTYGKNNTKYCCLIKTTPVYNSDEYILIKPKEFALEEDEIECEDLQITDTDMKGLFTVYSTKPQENSKVLSNAFIEVLADYAKTTGEKISILLTPKGILIAKNFGPVKKTSLCFSRADQYVYEYWQSTCDFLKILDLINLLEKK